MCGLSGGGSMRGSTACSSIVNSSLEQPAEVVRIDIVRRVDALRLHVLAVLIGRGRGRRRGATRQGAPCRATPARRPRRRLWAAPGTASTRGRTTRPGTVSAGHPRRPTRRRRRPVLAASRARITCHVGDVDCGDRPATASQPDRVGALAAADVEGPARREAGDLGEEPPIRASAPPRTVAARCTSRPTRRPAPPSRTASRGVRADPCSAA